MDRTTEKGVMNYVTSSLQDMLQGKRVGTTLADQRARELIAEEDAKNQSRGRGRAVIRDFTTSTSSGNARSRSHSSQSSSSSRSNDSFDFSVFRNRDRAVATKPSQRKQDAPRNASSYRATLLKPVVPKANTPVLSKLEKKKPSQRANQVSSKPRTSLYKRVASNQPSARASLPHLSSRSVASANTEHVLYEGYDPKKGLRGSGLINGFPLKPVQRGHVIYQGYNPENGLRGSGLIKTISSRPVVKGRTIYQGYDPEVGIKGSGLLKKSSSSYSR